MAFYGKPIVNVDIRGATVERKLCVGLIMDLFLPNIRRKIT
jgi:hypothetical protein